MTYFLYPNWIHNWNDVFIKVWHPEWRYFVEFTIAFFDDPLHFHRNFPCNHQLTFFGGKKCTISFIRFMHGKKCIRATVWISLKDFHLKKKINRYNFLISFTLVQGFMCIYYTDTFITYVTLDYLMSFDNFDNIYNQKTFKM